MLTHSFRDTILTGLDTHYCGLIKTITDLRAGTVGESDYTGYGTRPGITLGAAANTNPVGGRQRANSAAVTFPQSSSANQDAIAWGVWTASTAGTLKWIGFLDALAPVIATAAATDTLTAPAHGMIADQRVYVTAHPGALLPAGLTENTVYWVISPATDTFSLSTTQGGGAVNITAAGAIQVQPFTPRTIANGSTPEFAISALVLQV